MVAGAALKNDFLSPVAEQDYVVAYGSTRKIHPEAKSNERPSNISLSRI